MDVSRHQRVSRDAGRPVWVALATLLLTAAGALAQPYPGPIYMSALAVPTSGPGAVLAISPLGNVTTVVRALGGGPNALALANDDRTLLVGALRGGQVLEVDPAQNAVVRTVTAGVFTTITWISPTETGRYALTGDLRGQPGFYTLDGATGAVTTVRAGAPFLLPNTVVQDLVAGHYVVGDATADSLFQVARDGTVLAVWAQRAITPVSMVQDHVDGRLVIGSTFAQVVTFDPATQVLLKFGAVLNPNAIAFDRDRGAGQIVCGAFGPVVRFDRNGTLLSTLFQMPAGIVGTGMCFAASRTVVPIRVGAGNQWRFDLHFPGEAGHRYVFALSLSGFAPGFAVDARHVSLNFDPLTAATVFGALTPIVTNTSGLLDAAGRARAAVDLRPLGVPVPQIPVWGCALTIDPLAPSGVRTISKPVVFVLE